MQTYPTIRSQIDVVGRPNGRVALLMWGRPVEEHDYLNAILYLDLSPRSMALYFYHCATETQERRKVVVAESERIDSSLIHVLHGQILVDVVILDDRMSAQTLRIEHIQNFMATCRKLV